jgi:enoyl-CoA hydratase
MNFSTLKFEAAEGIGLITIARPHVLNALDSKFFEEMDALLAEVSGRSDIKVLILTGEGKAFVAGADISEMADKTKTAARKFSAAGQKTLRALELLDKVVIAAVNGFALGGGCELALACDIRIASVKAKFGQPEVNLGLIPGYAGTQRLSRLVGLGGALHLILSGEMMGAEDALRTGLVQKVVEPDQLLTAARELAKTIASKGPHAVRLAKKIIRQGWMMDFESGCALEAEAFGSLFESAEAVEGMKAFLEKRAPQWPS